MEALPKALQSLDEAYLTQQPGDHNEPASSVLTQVFAHGFKLRSENRSRGRDQAFLLEEMAKDLLNQNSKGSLRLLTCKKGKELEEPNLVKPIQNIERVLEFLLLMSGQATVFDKTADKDSISEFGQQYLSRTILKAKETAENQAAYSLKATDAMPAEKRLSVNMEHTHVALSQQVEAQKRPNLFGPRQGNNLRWDAPEYAATQCDEEDEFLKQHSELSATPLSSFFTMYTGSSFSNPYLSRSLEEEDDNERRQRKLARMLMVGQPLTEKKDQAARAQRSLLLSEAPMTSLPKNMPDLGSHSGLRPNLESAHEGFTMGAFSHPGGIDTPFGMTLEIPPLPSRTVKAQIDPFDKHRGEKLITKTFFSFGDKGEADDLAGKKKTASTFFQTGPVSEFEEGPKTERSKASETEAPSDIFFSNIPGSKKRTTKEQQKAQVKQLNKELTKAEVEAAERERKRLLVSLFSFVDESKLHGNMDDESGVRRLWEDEKQDLQANPIALNESGLLTKEKIASWNRSLSHFQNSLILSRDLASGTPNETLLTEEEIVDKCLLLLSGIPSTGVFDLDQDTFTFSMNGNRRVYFTSSRDDPAIKLSLNPALFQDLMEAGSYFLHLREFVQCMQTPSAENPGLVLQAFSLSLSDFLQFQIMDNRQACQHKTFLELKIHLEQVLAKLKLLATLCFTQKFIDDIEELREAKKQEQMLEMEEEGFEQFQKLLYGENKFTVHNLQEQFQKNLEKIRSQSWLEEFPKGSALLTYLYKTLMACESDLQAVGLLRTIFARAIQPLLSMISEFIFTGDFKDPFQEFFVEKKKGQFSLTQNPRKIPDFIGSDLATAIFKVGSHVSLLQSVESRRQGERAYAEICNPQCLSPAIGDSLEKKAAFVHPTKTIYEADPACLKLRFDIFSLKALLGHQQAVYGCQIGELQKIEAAIVQAEQLQVRSLIQLKQESLEKFQRQREQQLLAQRQQIQEEKARAMRVIQSSITEARQQKELELRQAKLEKELEQIQRMQIEQIKTAIAEDLKKQYLQIMANETQALGDIRDADVKDQEKLAQELEDLIQEGQKKKLEIETEIERDRPSDSQAPKDEINAKKEAPVPVAAEEHNRAASDVEMRDEGERPSNEPMLSVEDVQIDLPEVPEVDPRVRQRELEEATKFILEVFTKPLERNVWRTIDERRWQAHKRRTWNLKKQEQQIQSAQQKRSNLVFSKPIVSIRNKLSAIFDKCTSEKEKSQAEAGEDKLAESINVPVHLALNQCLFSQVKDQFKVVNKCMLHMMYRREGLFNHLKALKAFFLGGQGDILQTFAGLIFHDNMECTLKDNSLYFINNQLEFSLRQLEPLQQAADMKQAWNPNIETHHSIFSDYQRYAQALQFVYLPKGNLEYLMMTLHNMENYIRLTYKVQHPLSLVLTDEAQAKYNSLFFMLLKLKKILLLLTTCWKQLNSVEFRREENQRKVRQIQALRSAMHNFITTFQEYIMVDAIEASWHQFRKKLSHIQVFEDLQKAHTAFLDKILDRSMLGRKETKIAQFIIQIFSVVQRLCGLVKEYDTELVQESGLTAWHEFEEIKGNFSEQSGFFKKFIRQLAGKGHYTELNGRLLLAGE